MMDKKQDDSYPPPYPGTVGCEQYPGGFAQPPPSHYGAPPPQGPAPNYPAGPPLMPGYAPSPTPSRTPSQQILVVPGAINYGKHPLRMTCPNCQRQIQTSIESEPGPMAWIIGGVLCLLGLCCCACIPCCIDDFNQVEHKCPNCNAFLGRYKGGM